MDLELKVEKDELGKKIIFPKKQIDNYTAYSFNDSENVFSLSAIVEGRKLISHYKKEDKVWKMKSIVRSGPLVIGCPTYAEGTPEYQAFELLSKE